MNAQQQTYNGWTNFATWGVALVLDNDEPTYRHVRERAAEIRTEARGTTAIGDPDAAAKFDLADWLKDYAEELCGLGGDDLSLMARQVLQAGLSEVNWEEIAANILDEDA